MLQFTTVADSSKRGFFLFHCVSCLKQVMLYDSGAEKTVDIHCLRKLEESMKIIRTLAIECSLADIR